MKRIRYGRLAALVTASAVALTACGSDPETSSGSNDGGSDSNLSGELAGAGASSQEAAMNAWRSGFGSNNPDVTVSYDPVGSGGGRTQFGEGAVAFAGTDAVMDEEERAAAKESCGSDAIHLPLYISPIAVVYNIEGVDGLQLSPATIAGIFDQKIKKWNDPAIAADNPGANLPDLAVTPVNRSDESGTTENFTEYLAAAAGDAWPHEPSGDWPVSGSQSAQGTSGVVQTVQGGQGTIGYADASQAGNLGVAKVKVGEQFVEYSADAAAKVVDESPKAEGGVEHDLAIELQRDTTAEGTYPIVLVSYLVVCSDYTNAKANMAGKGELVKAFVSHVASQEGQEAASGAAGSAPISDTLRADVEAALEAMKV
ncbi:phosphate ABC transporter substrate-binding protein PstS [Actinophytocola glycyrrhizae]|uniref:Phosphate-binding protein n=1 Tax=Actinophytocola glycyrrhizae TaxID=2044873 RepID=A0ABV9SEG4_9PSEU